MVTDMCVVKRGEKSIDVSLYVCFPLTIFGLLSMDDAEEVWDISL